MLLTLPLLVAKTFLLITGSSPLTQIIRKGKSSKPTEFGRLIKIQEAENQIVTHYEVCAERPADSTLLVKSVEVHQQQFGHAPHTLATDAGFYSNANEKGRTGWASTMW